jgi:MFS family permease
MSNVTESNTPANANRLLWAGFVAILASGVGFAIRGGILDNWGAEFGFTATELGNISGAGFTGFCFGIIIGGVIADKIGYGKLVIAAFVFHILSAFVTFAPGQGTPKETAGELLFWGTFIFAVANGTLEAVANPLVATLFSQNRTHYLNILHASWPAGLVLGSAAGWLLDDKLQLSWKLQLALFLLPTLAYGVMFFGQHFPKSEASQKGLSLGEMFRDVGILGSLVVCALLALFFGGVLTPFFKTSPDTAKYVGYAIGAGLLVVVAVITRFSFGSLLLFALFAAHLLVGAVELGTDNWIQNITGNILTSEQGKILFVFTSATMFALRFCANFIEKRIGLSPVGILLACAILACVGLNLTSGIASFGGAMLALTVYGIGKTFFWPTMLAVASDRFPRTGAVAISIMGGIGTMSAGLLGAPGLGYAKDRFAGEELNKTNPAVFAEYKAESPSRFLPFIFDEATGLDGKKLGAAKLTPQGKRDDTQKAVVEADQRGDRRTLVADSFIPAAMAGIYLLILLYFRAIGGYKPVHLEAAIPEAKGVA